MKLDTRSVAEVIAKALVDAGYPVVGVPSGVHWHPDSPHLSDSSYLVYIDCGGTSHYMQDVLVTIEIHPPILDTPNYKKVVQP